MTMQKGRQSQYLRPDSPPSNLKKSPLAMLVETCSSIGQELTKSSTTPASLASSFDRKKSSPNGSKPNSPSSRPSPLHHRIPPTKTNNLYGSVNPAAAVAAAGQFTNLTAQYQFMYQQLLYQAELEYQRANSKSGGVGTNPLKPACNVCSLTPGYTGHCAHTDGHSINPAMLAMLNPSAALAYSKLMGLNAAPAADTPLQQQQQQGLLRSSSLSPPTAHDSRRSSASSNVTSSPPHPLNTREQPIDLARQRSPSPLPQKECHWVGAEGYCGKRFHSQDDLMSHLKYHVITCPNVTPENQQHRSRSPLKSYKDSSFNSSTASAATNNVLHKHRYNPYSLTDKHLTTAMLRH